MPYLCGQQLLGYVDGFVPCPATTVTQIKEGQQEQVANPVYSVWIQQDQIILRTLLSSVAPEVLS